MKNQKLIKIGFFLLISIIAFFSIEAQSNQIPIEEKLRNLPIKNRAYLQEELADLVIEFSSWDTLYCYKPEIKQGKYPKELNKEKLLYFLKKKKINTQLAVVIFYKHSSSEEKMQDINKVLKENGFQKVIFQEGVNYKCETGRPILNELHIAPLWDYEIP